MGVRSAFLESYGNDFAWSLLNAMPDATLIVAASGEIVFVNDHAAAMFGFAPAELLGKIVEELLPEALRRVHGAHRHRYADLPAVRAMGAGFELRARRSDGSEIPVEISLSPLVLGDKPFVIAGVRDITERVAADAALSLSHDALVEADQVLAVAADRERIARDLHDTVIQRLFGEGLSIQATLAGGEVPTRLRSRLRATVEGLDETIKELRMAIFSLQGGGAAPGGLRGRLLDVITDASAGLGFTPRLQFDGPIETTDDTIAAHLPPVLREALSNIAHHAHAHHVRVTLASGDHLTLTVADDGVGVPQQTLGGRGLTNLDERARLMGGTCTIGVQATGGSLLTWCVPAIVGSAQPARPAGGP